MKPTIKRLLAVAGLLSLGLGAVKAQQDDALLDALVKKGVLSSQEANDVRADAAKSYDSSLASKISLPSYVTKIKFYGDARLRYEYLDETPQDPGFPGTAAGAALGHNSSTTDRVRYRLRFGIDYSFTDNFKAGFELESNSAGDSANQTLGNAFEKYPINVGLVYLQYNPTDWLQLVAGKFKQPLYTTDLTWDPDINPEGGAENFTFNFPLGSSPTVISDPKDVKDFKRVVDPKSDMSLTIGFNAAQYIYADNNEYNNTNPGNAAAATTPNSDRTDVWMFVEQVPVQFNYNKATFVKVVPEFTSYMGGGNSGLSSSVTSSTSTAIGGGSAVTFANPHAADNLQIFGAPGEVDWKVGAVPMKAYWDFTYNLDGKSRIQDTYLGNGQGPVTVAGNTQAATLAQNRDLDDAIAWMAGLQVGNTLKKGDWSFRGDFRQVGLGATDPNTNDSDWGDSFLNQQGIKVQGNYQFTDFLTGTVTYYDTWAYKNNLLNGSTPGQNPVGLPLANGGGVGAATTVAGATTTETASLEGIHTSQRVEVDLQWKF